MNDNLSHLADETTYCPLCDCNQTMRPDLVLVRWHGEILCTECLEELLELEADTWQQDTDEATEESP